MKILLVGDANSIFLNDFTTWLKKTMDAEVVIYSIYQLNGDYVDLPFDKVFQTNYDNTFWSKIKGIRALAYPFILNIEFNRFLRTHNEKYDIIHFHWIISAWVLSFKNYKKYCAHLFATFWGGEKDVQNILFSRRLYRIRTKSFLKEVDCIVGNNKLRENGILKLFPFIKDKYKFGTFGSTPLEILYSLQETTTSRESKLKMGMNPDKISVLLGYSGKKIHNHCDIINSLMQSSNYQIFKEKIQLIGVMSRGGNEIYTNEVEMLLVKSGFDYVLAKNIYLNDAEIAELRNATDVVFQLSSFDALSRSILECLCAGSIVISGNWLNYLYFKDEGFKFIEVANIEESINELYRITMNFETYKETYSENIENGRNRYLWKECIKDWTSHYQEVLQ